MPFIKIERKFIMNTNKYETISQESFTMNELAALIDHSLLTPFTTRSDLDRFLSEIVDYNFQVACLNNVNTEYGANKLAGTGAIVATVVAFPFGALAPDAKAAEVENAIKKGAGTIDIVCNIGAIKSAEWDLVYRDMAECAEMSHKYDRTIKAILETCYLTREEIAETCKIAKKAGMDYVKTSTGFATAGFISLATIGEVKLMKSIVGMDMGVKASGPIGDYDTAVALIHAGAHRIGSRKGVELLKGCSDYK